MATAVNSTIPSKILLIQKALDVGNTKILWFPASNLAFILLHKAIYMDI